MELPPGIVAVSRSLIEAGGRPYVVGGSVRDSLMGNLPSDFDLTVCGLDRNKLESVLVQHCSNNVDEVGKNFGVYKMKLKETGEQVDFALPRKDRHTGGGHHRDLIVDLDPNFPIEIDLGRRDLTVNSIAFDIKNGSFVDPFNGVNDIESSLLRATSPTAFSDDALRIWRVFEFSSRFGFDIDPEIISLARSVSDSDFAKVPIERHREIWMKWVLKATKPEKGLDFLLSCRLLHPAIMKLYGIQQNPDHHNGDVYLHTVQTVQHAIYISNKFKLSEDERIDLVLSALCHDLGKAETYLDSEGFRRSVTRYENGKIVSYGHEESGKSPTEDFLRSIGIQTESQIRRIVWYVERHMDFYQWNDKFIYSASPGQMDRKVAKLMNKAHSVGADTMILCLLSMADRWNRPSKNPAENMTMSTSVLSPIRESIERVKSTPEVIAPLVTGLELISNGVKPGKRLGELKEAAHQAQLDGVFTTPLQGVEWLRSKFPDDFVVTQKA